MRKHRSLSLIAVVVNKLAVVGTMDEDVLKAQETKGNNQNRLMDAVKAKINKYLK